MAGLFKPETFAKAPSAAKLPFNTTKGPVGFKGFFRSLTTSWWEFNGLTFSRFSAKVLPVTVKQSPCNNPASRSIFITPGTPPTLYKSYITYLPEGFKSARCGTFLLILSKSSKLKLTPTAWAIASRCKAEFVEPPNAITTVIAFSNAFFVIISFGVMFFSSIWTTYFEDSKHSPFFLGSSAGIEEEFGNDMPNASIAEAIVFAVYIPPQLPAPGHARHSIW